MSIAAPIISSVLPVVNDTDVELRPTIQIFFAGSGLIDQLSWGPNTFALYGPGDVVLDTGPGTILNSGMDDAPYPILDGPLRRDRQEGTYRLTISGTSGLDTADAENRIGTASQIMIGQFTPSSPLNPNTEYVAVLAGDDIVSLLNTADRRFPGITTFTSPSGFAISGTGEIVSGFISVASPYSKILHTNQYNVLTNLNDIYTITITSGTSSLGFKYNWKKASSAGTFSAVVSGTTDRHSFGDGLTIDFTGTFLIGETYTMNVYAPVPLAQSVVWKFNTGVITSYATPPSVPGTISVVIDETVGGGFGVDTTAESAEQFYVVSSFPANLDHAVYEGLPYIAFEFNKNLVSGFYDPAKVVIQSTPLLGIGVEESALAPVNVTPSQLETSGRWLKIWL